MLSACLLSFVEWILFALRLLRAIPAAGVWQIPRRIILFFLIWVLAGVLNIFHWVGFLLDECFFPHYRKIAVTKPVFIVGIPRSGTTWLQRVLANDSNLTTLSLWETVLAPSICERIFWHGVIKLFTPVNQWITRLNWQPLKKLDAIHKIRLDEPEEDFLLLAPLHACFLWVTLCPDSNHYWQLTRFDERRPHWRNTIALQFYRHCLQKHLAYHGEHLQILSKNPSFTPFINSLKTTFPDARFIVCVRDPLQAVPSQLSALLPTLQLLGFRKIPGTFQQRILDMLNHYYQIIKKEQHQQQWQTPNLAIVDMPTLQQQLQTTVHSLYRTLSLDYSQQLQQTLKTLEQQGRGYTSQHHYDLTQFGLNKNVLHRYFFNLWPLHTIDNHNAL